MKWALWLAMLVACGDQAAPAPDANGGTGLPVDTAHSGTRLKLAWFDFGDGVRTWTDPTDLYDVELQAACTPTRWDDGITRCTPKLTDVWYLDSACTQPVVKPDPSTRFAAGSVSARCHAVAPSGPIYVAAAQTMKTTQLWSFSDGGCIPVPIYPPGTMVSYATIEQTLPPSRLVGISTKLQGTGELAVTTLVGDDGLIVPRAPYDSVHHVTCGLDELEQAAEGPCLAQEAIGADVFADPLCQLPAIRGDTTCAPLPSLASRVTFSCPRYYTVSSMPSDIYTPSYNGCTVEQPASGAAFALGSYVELARLSRAPETGTAREQLIYLSHGDTRVRDPHRVFDKQLMTECKLGNVMDGGTAQCRPAGRAYIALNLFSDTSCTQPLPPMAEVDMNGSCVVQTPPRYLDTTLAIYRIGPRHIGDVYRQGVASCDPTFYPLFDLGEQISESALATAVKVRDP